MLRKLLLFLSFFTFVVAARGQNLLFEKNVFQHNGTELNYRLLRPHPVVDAKTYPVILFLHGAGERGNNNSSQLTYVDTVFGSDRFIKKYPAYVVLPQCPRGKRWVDVDWGATVVKQPKKVSHALELAMALLDSLQSALPVDTTRIYVMGLSMGGFGSWDALYRRPEKFAAGVIISGGADTAIACRIKDIPVWVFHGAKDPVVSIALDRKMVKALINCGAKPIYTEYPNVKHGAWFKALVDKELYVWLFSQKKQ